MITKEPKIIYLQIGEEADITEFKKEDFETNSITWCWEKIYNSDIEYINKSYLVSLIDNMMAKSPNLFEYLGYNEALTELKERLR